ncbi:MAG TPA: TonB-dependent receptor plug domain-containing protein [Candidatus Acidoferrales bacterium]|nr:TonB-dependent receptor plug domain-containing protein [Candidatus Acidoferrales bacterium]
MSNQRFSVASLIFLHRFTIVLAASAALLGSQDASPQSPPAPAAPVQPAGPRDLATVSLEDLMNLRVTSVSKTEQKMSQVAAALAVITQEDIIRSGATNIPDLLRMVPGMDVSQINANSWAVSARGFNQQFSNKLLVLIDGRAVYTPLLGGVNWDTQDVLLEDIDRIEVIRGPGATVWGANAVNGVINIVTKRAADTKGGLLSAGGGTERQADASAQFGGTVRGNTDYRVYAKYLNRGSLPDFDGSGSDDGWHLLHGGLRADTALSSKDSLTLETDVYTGSEGATIVHISSIDPPVVGNLNTIDRLGGGSILGRWDHTFSSRAGTSFQFYYDNYERTGPESEETLKIVDFEFNHHFGWGERQNIVWGMGYRHFADEDEGTIDQSFNPPNAALQQFTFFGEDTVALRPDRLYLTFGTKIENSYFTGYGLEPSVRLAWTPVGWATFWSAVSRSERSPARRDSQLVAPLSVFPDPNGSSTPVEVILFGDPKFVPEHVIAYESGFRAQPNGRISVDISAFFNQYDHLESLEPGTEFLQSSPPPARLVMPIVFGNLLYGTTEGGEVSANLKLTDRWTLSPGYAFLEMHLKPRPASQDQISVAEIQGSSPQHQAQLRSHVDLSHGLSWDASAYFVSALPVQGVSSYTRVDTQLLWKFAERAEFSLVGQNLLREEHLESMDAITLVNSSLIKRNAYAKLTWRFP